MGTATGTVRMMSKPKHHRPAVALYGTTLFISMLIVATGLALISVQTAERHIQQSIQKSEDALRFARAGVEYAFSYIELDPDWRTNQPNGDWLDGDSLGPGTVTLSVTDDDGSLSDDEADPITITAEANLNDITTTLEASAAPRPHPGLQYACFGYSKVLFKNTPTVLGPVRSNVYIQNDSDGVTTGDDAIFEVYTGGSIDWGLEPQSTSYKHWEPPAPDIEFYKSQATQLNPEDEEIEQYNLTPTYSTEGVVNPNGIYWLNTASNDIFIKDTHIKGTLIITGTSNINIKFENAGWIEPAHTNYPTLLIDLPNGIVVIKYDGSDLEEDNLGDLNGDGDDLDVFPPLVEGIVWTSVSKMKFQNAAWTFHGAAFADRIEVEDDVIIDNDPTLADNVPPGFYDYRVKALRGSWKELAQ